MQMPQFFVLRFFIIEMNKAVFQIVGVCEAVAYICIISWKHMFKSEVNTKNI